MNYPDYRLISRYCYACRLLIQFLCIFICASHSSVFAANSNNKLQNEFTKAVQRSDANRIKALIADGADVNMDVGGLTPIMLARKPEIISLLAEAGANVNARSELLKQTALMLSVSKAKQDMVKALIDAGADVNAADPDTGMTPLAVAMHIKNRKKQLSMIEMLTGAGANPDITVLGIPLISSAVMTRNTDLVKVLIDAGADVNVTNDKGVTPVMMAVSSNNVEMTQLLVGAGADLNKSMKESPKGSGSKGTGKGRTAMDIADMKGNEEIKDELRKGGAEETEELPEPDYNKPNKPGLYNLTCSLTGSPPPQGTSFSCSSVGDVADSGVEISVLSQVFYAAKHVVPRKNGCQFDLGQPGMYKVLTTRISTDWELVCSAGLGTTGGGKNWIAFIKKKEPVITKTERKLIISKSTSIKDATEEKERPSIKIVTPSVNDQFSYDSSAKGLLVIEVEAEVSPAEYADQVVWKMDGIKSATKTIDPPQGNSVTIQFEGLPMVNDFGKKKITASVAGQSDSVEIEVFFDPVAKNHPGVLSGATPNWFYYWGQTSAVQGKRPFIKYTSALAAKNNPGDLPLARFEPDDTIWLADLVYDSDHCTNRGMGAPGGGPVDATGIDCFAEAIRHEWHHKQEYDMWWKGKNVNLAVYDKDNDGVPAHIERGLRGCRDDEISTADFVARDLGVESAKQKIRNSWYSCAQRPFNNATDKEVFAYHDGWRWVLTTANHEDWSRCGKQWSDATVCPGGKTK